MYDRRETQKIALTLPEYLPILIGKGYFWYSCMNCQQTAAILKSIPDGKTALHCF